MSNKNALSIKFIFPFANSISSTNTTSTTTNSSVNNQFTIGGVISGLNGTVSIKLNGSETLTVSTNGSFQFTTQLNSSSTYSVTVSTHPNGQNCSITNSSGTISSNITNVTVQCLTGNSNGVLVGGNIFNTLNLTNQITTIVNVGGSPNGITTDGLNIYYAYNNLHTVWKYEIATGVNTQIAGTGIAGSTDGAPLSSSFNAPSSLLFLNNALYITDFNNGSIRKLDFATNTVSTLITGKPFAYGLTSDGTYLYYSYPNQVERLDLGTLTSTLIAGATTTGYQDGTGATVRFNNYFNVSGGLTFDGTDLFINDIGNCSIRRIVISTGSVSTIAGSPPPTQICGTIVDAIGTSSRLNVVDGILSDGTNLYFMENVNCVVRRITTSTLSVDTIAGLNNNCSLLDGTGSSARLSNPALLTTDGSRIYFTENSSGAIRRIE
ncbi:MAG: hypothetical protein SFU98_05335 [Leptospiraceae bacterium]|nr:hypothetical protein [Leptospiraceae bacterium]